MRMWRLLGCLLGLALLSSTVSAKSELAPRILLNEVPLSTQVAHRPFILSGTTMVALDDVARLLGADPEWNATTQQAWLRKGSRSIRFRVGSDQAEVDGQFQAMSVAPVQMNMQLFVPLRFVAERFGATVDWDAAGQRVRIQRPIRFSPMIMMQPENKSWWDPSGFPEPYTGSFWAPERPKELPPVAYGTLGYHQPIPEAVSIASYSLQAELPQVPATLPVYLQGGYPPELKERFHSLVERPEDWYFVPQWALLNYLGERPIGAKAAVGSPEEAERRAAELLGPLLQGDYRAEVRSLSTGWSVLFHRYVKGIRNVGRPLTVTLNAEGQATNVSGRYKPLLAWSAYPLLKPEAAWDLLREGRWLQLFTDQPQLKGTVAEFAVTEVELIYHDQHADFALQTMPPYYAFRNKEGYALYVPAVADPYTTRP